MIGDKPQISMLSQLEKEGSLTGKEEAGLLEMLKESVAEAVALKNELTPE
jgi:hypothetical protein